MSLVGPRPYLPREIDDMKNAYGVIVKHKPGVTGVWQISGRSDVTFDDRISMDLQYHKDCNAVKDIKIICKTVVSVFKHEGVA